MSRTAVYVCPTDCTFTAAEPGRCTSHPYPCRGMGPDLVAVDHGHVEGLLPWGLCCPDCTGLPSRPLDGCISPHHFQEVQTEDIGGFIYPVCLTCGTESAGWTERGERLRCGSCQQPFPGWFYEGPVRIEAS